MERERLEREKEEAAMAATMQNRQKKLLNDLAEEEAKREDAVRSLQQMKDKEKEGLITSLSNGTWHGRSSSSSTVFEKSYFCRYDFETFADAFSHLENSYKLLPILFML